VELGELRKLRDGFAAAGILPFDPQRVLDKLDISISTPTPPQSRGRDSTSSSMLATPHTARQLFKKASSDKKILRRGSRSPSSPSKRNYNELLKGCESIMHQAAFMSKELHDLRAIHEKSKREKSRSKRQMTPNEGLSIQVVRDPITLRNEQLNEQGGGLNVYTSSASEPLTTRKRAPPRCSECGIQGHTRVRCPNRQNN
jgi:hypothetical protein